MSLTAKNISVTLAGKTILSRVSVTLPTAQCTAIIGTNGAGKSTLLRALAGILPVTNGEVLLDGQNIGQIKRRMLAQRLAILPQTNNAPPDLTVERLVGYGRFPYRKWWGNDAKGERYAVERVLKQTKMYELREREVNTLSGGERQRAWLAMALAQLDTGGQTVGTTKFLLLDEPTTYLDISHQIEVLNTIRAVQIEQRITTVMVMHDLNHALRYADEVLLIHNAGIYRQGKPANILTPELLKEIFSVKADVFYNQGGESVLGFS